MEATTICAHCSVKSEGRPLVCPSCGDDPRVQGRYRIEGELGRGGSGVTWRARREPGGEPVCLKELRWATMGSLDDERRFSREGQLLEALDHPAIPKHHGAFTWGEGRSQALFIAQELVVGDNLEVERKARGYTLKEALEAGAEIADVLVYLHARHPPVVHRDLKPSNIMRRVDGRLVLIDFGAARLGGIGDAQVSVAGTFGFMAPEQIRGEAGAPADVYGLGMTLGVLLSGGPPEGLLATSNLPDFSRIPDLRGDLRALLAEMCALDPGARPTAAAVARRCREMLAGPKRVVVPRPEPVDPTPVRRPGSKLGVVIAVFTMSIIVAVGAMVMTITMKVSDTVDSALAMAKPSEARPFGRVTPEPPPVAVPEPPTLAEAAPEPAPEVDPVPLAAEGCGSGQASACDLLVLAVSASRAQVLALPGWPKPLVDGCDKGVGVACHQLALVHAQGIGVTESRLETRKYFGKSCDLGVLEGCAAFGDMLLKGDGGPKDWKAALPLLERACAGGQDDDSCLSTGAIYAQGEFGAKADRVKALGMFEALCQKGMHAACENIDAMIGNNWGLPASGSGRSDALNRLCTGRSGAACEKLGDAYARGSGGIKKDATRARELYTQGCDFGAKSACEKMKVISA